MKIILASASPRRSELLRQAGLAFEIIPSTVEEKMEGETPSEIVMSLARQKAEDVFTSYISGKHENTEESAAVIGSDTIVVCDGERLGKPEDDAHAFAMLKMLQNRSHEVYTGVCICFMEDGSIHKEVFYDSTEVVMYPVTDAQAQWYVSTKEPADKAGAYGIQGKGAVFIKEIHGDYNNVVGLPLAKVWHCLERHGFVKMISDTENKSPGSDS